MLPWQPFLAFYIWGANWRHLKNTTKPSMCGGDAALCQLLRPLIIIIIIIINSLYLLIRLSPSKLICSVKILRTQVNYVINK